MEHSLGYFHIYILLNAHGWLEQSSYPNCVFMSMNVKFHLKLASRPKVLSPASQETGYPNSWNVLAVVTHDLSRLPPKSLSELHTAHTEEDSSLKSAAKVLKKKSPGKFWFHFFS